MKIKDMTPKQKNEYFRNWRRNNSLKWKKLHQENLEKNSREVRNCWKNDYKKKKKYCELCGSKEKLEFHHIDYICHSGITVCFKCHRYKIHSKLKLKGGVK